MSPGSGARVRVAIVIGHLGYGGAERQLFELVVRARHHGIDFHVFCLGGAEEPYGPQLRANGVALTTVARRGSFDWRRALRLASLLRERAFDLVHSFLIDTNPYAFFASRLARIPAFVASNRNANFPRGPVRATIDGWVFRRASAVLVNARAVEAFTARRFAVPLDRVFVVYNGVDLERFRPPAGAGAGAYTIGTVGSLTAKKNPQLFAEVAGAVRARNPDVRCLHLGDGPMRETLQSRFGQTVEFRGSSNAVEEFLRGVDVFVLTSNREGCPNVLLEAMACARPVVATDAGGVSEIVRDGVSGYVVSLGDQPALTERVLRLLADRDLRARIGGAARAEVESRFPLSRMVDETVDLYRRVAGNAVRMAAA